MQMFTTIIVNTFLLALTAFTAVFVYSLVVMGAAAIAVPVFFIYLLAIVIFEVEKKRDREGEV